jgi:Peptidase family M28
VPGADYQDELYRFVESVLREIGPRESCSESERRLGERLAAEWRRLGHEVRVETFNCHPKAFLGFIPFSALLYLAATVMYWVWAPACVLLAGTSAALIACELVRYRELVDPLFPAAEGANVVGVIRPRAEVRRRVIVSAHQDSAYEFTLWYLLEAASIPIMVIGFAAVAVPLLGGLARSLAAAPDARAFALVGYVCIGLYPFVGLNLFFHTYSTVPGAMDDLTGVSILLGVARALAGARADGQPALEHTEVRLLATSSEEAGLRGAKRYVGAHRRELHEVPTYGLFVDGVYDERHLTAIHRELFTGVRHDPRLLRLAGEVAAERGWQLREHALVLGATDASPFSQAGVPAVTLLCQDATRLVPNYHTRRDTLEHVRPASLGVMLHLVLEMIRRIDADGLPTAPPDGGNLAPKGAEARRADAP